MKTSMNQDNKSARHNDYPHESLSVKDALVWFVITVVALCIAGTSHAQTTTIFKCSVVKTAYTSKHLSPTLQKETAPSVTIE